MDGRLAIWAQIYTLMFTPHLFDNLRVCAVKGLLLTRRKVQPDGSKFRRDCVLILFLPEIPW